MTKRFDVAFVRSAPDELAAGVLYVSMEHAAVMHLCACGCGHQVVLELDPHEHTLTYDGRGVSLHPSVGNWSFPCHSHYWVRDSTVVWAPAWTPEQVAAGRERDAARWTAYDISHPAAASRQESGPWWRRLGRLLRR